MSSSMSVYTDLQVHQQDLYTVDTQCAQDTQAGGSTNYYANNLNLKYTNDLLEESLYRSNMHQQLLEKQYSDEEATEGVFHNFDIWDKKFIALRSIHNPTQNHYAEMASLSDQFCECAATYAKMIVAERHIPEGNKKIKPLDVGGIAGGTKFEVHGLFFKYPVDPEVEPNYYLYGGFTPNHGYAAKASNNDFKGLVHFMFKDKEKFFQVPLSALIDYQGHRLTVMTTLPISDRTLVYGSPNAGKNVHTDPIVHQQLLKIAQESNIRPHLVVDKEQAFCGDLEVHSVNWEEKNYYFIIDSARIFPPDAHFTFVNPSPPGAPFYRLLRSELVANAAHPLSSDSLTQWQKSDPNSEEMNTHTVEATSQLEDYIQNFADYLSSNSGLVIDALNFSKNPQFLGILVQDKIVQELHSRGINVRYCGKILIQMENKEMVNDSPVFLFSFMMVRTLKNLWRARIRSKKNSSVMNYLTCHQVTEDLLNSIMQIRSERTSPTWSELKVQFIETFALGILDRNQTNVLSNLWDKYLDSFPADIFLNFIIIRFCEICGIKLSPNTIHQLSTNCNHLFSKVDVIEFIPVMKILPILEYYSALHLINQAMTFVHPKGRKNLLLSAVFKLHNLLIYPFSDVKYYHSKALLELMKIDRTYFSSLDSVNIQLKEKFNRENTAQYYFDYLCGCYFKLFYECKVVEPDEEKVQNITNLFVERYENDPSTYFFPLTLGEIRRSVSQVDLLINDLLYGCGSSTNGNNKIFVKNVEFTQAIKERLDQIQFVINYQLLLEFYLNNVRVMEEIKMWDLNSNEQMFLFHDLSVQDIMQIGFKNNIHQDKILDYLKAYRYGERDPAIIILVEDNKQALRLLTEEFKIDPIKRTRDLLNHVFKAPAGEPSSEMAFLKRYIQDFGSTPPIFSAVADMNILHLFLQRKADPNVRDKDGNSLLPLALTHSTLNFSKMITKLLDSGFRIDNEEVCRLLLNQNKHNVQKLQILQKQLAFNLRKRFLRKEVNMNNSSEVLGLIGKEYPPFYHGEVNSGGEYVFWIHHKTSALFPQFVETCHFFSFNQNAQDPSWICNNFTKVSEEDNSISFQCHGHYDADLWQILQSIPGLSVNITDSDIFKHGDYEPEFAESTFFVYDGYMKSLPNGCHDFASYELDGHFPTWICSNFNRQGGKEKGWRAHNHTCHGHIKKSVIDQIIKKDS